MPKFFVEPSKISNGIITIDTDDVNHITRVLRMKTGDVITVCDSMGYDYSAEIFEINKSSVLCKEIDKTKSDTEPELKVVLFQGIPKGSKMEYIIQKTTELGIFKIVPVSMSRCVSKIENKKDGDKKKERWQKISESAAKQSGRGIVPEVEAPVSFETAVEALLKCDVVFAPYECEQDNSIKNVIKGVSGNKTVGFIIGPEGGFSPEEIDRLTKCGIPSVTLGKRILRTETAGEAVLSMLMYEANEI